MLERETSIRGMTPEIAPFHFSDRCHLITGAKRAAIYDLEKGDVYSLNEAALKVINGFPDKFGFWRKLTEMGLIETSHNTSLSSVESKIPQVGLEFMWLELTEKCNQKCLHCYASAGEFVQTRELSVAKWEEVMGEGSVLGCRRLQFIGGEPLLFRGIFDLAQAASDLNYEFIEIFTNGTLLDENKIEKIKELGIHVAISLYSIVPEIHDTVTQVPGSFQKTFKALEMLREAKIPTRIGIVVMKQNEDTALETRRRLQEMRFNDVGIDVLRPTGRGSCNYLLPKDEIIQTWALMTKPDFSVNEEEFYRNQHWNSCWAGKIAITADGGIMPCIFARKHVVSNVERGLGEAVNSEKLQHLWKITKDQVEGCRDCEYRYACHDCRPLAEDTTGNLYAKSPRCTYNPLIGKWVKPLKKGGEKGERARTDD